MSQIYYILSGKGGTGKSSFALNLAATFAISGRKTLLVDMNPGMRSLDLYLGVEDQAVYHVFDVLNGLCPAGQAIMHPDVLNSLSFLAGGTSEDAGTLTDESWNSLLDQLRPQFEIIVVDGAPGWDETTRIISKSSDKVILVTTPENAAVRDADGLEDRLIRCRVMKRCYVLNRVDPDLILNKLEPHIKEVDRRFRCEMLGMISEDVNFRAASDAGVPVVLKRDSYIAENFNKMADRLNR